MRPLRRKIEGAIKTRATRIIADDDLVAVEARGENCNTYCFVFRLEGGKLKEVTEYRTPSLRRGCWATRGSDAAIPSSHSARNASIGSSLAAFRAG
jgi:hypothetical protein